MKQLRRLLSIICQKITIKLQKNQVKTAENVKTIIYSQKN